MRTTPSLGRTQPAPAAHTRYLSSPAGACRSHFTRKNTRFPAPAFSQNEAHATSMQPLQCVLHAKIPKHHVTAMCRHKQNTSEQPLQCGLLPALAEPSPHLPRTRGTFHRRPEPLYPKEHKVSCPGFLPKRSPCNIHAAITMRLATSGFKLHCVLQAKIPKHHVTAMCKNRQNTSKQPLQCGLLPALAEPSPHPPRTRGTFHRRPEPLYPKEHKVSCPGFLPKNEAHATSMPPLQCVLPRQVSNYNAFRKQRFQNTM